MTRKQKPKPSDRPDPSPGMMARIDEAKRREARMRVAIPTSMPTFLSASLPAEVRGSNPLRSTRKSARGLRCDRRRSTELPVTMGNAHTE
jgi:hypothetical protein